MTQCTRRVFQLADESIQSVTVLVMTVAVMVRCAAAAAVSLPVYTPYLWNERRER